MTIKYRALATAVTVAVAVGLAGCSGGTSQTQSSDGKPSGTVTGIFDAQYKAALDPIIADFEAKYPDVKVDMKYQGGELGPAILTQLQAGTAPDVLLTFPGGSAQDSSDNVVPLAAQGRLLPINPDWAKDIPENWKPQVEQDGKLYAFPGAVQPLSAIYNQSLLDQFGLKPPTTLDEVYKLCGDAKKNGVYAYAQGLGDHGGPQMLAFAQMASLLYGSDPTWDQGLASGTANYTDSKWVDQFEISDKMFKAGCFGDGALGRSRSQGQEAVSSHQALGLVDVGAVLAGMMKSAPNDKFLVAAMPATNDGNNSITALPGYTLTINAKAKNPEAAKAFLEFAGTPAETAKFATGFGSVPLIPNPQFEAPTHLKDFAAQAGANKTAALASLQPEVQTTLNTALQSMFLGNDTPQSVAKKLQDAYKK